MRGRSHFTDDPARQCHGKLKFTDKRAAKLQLKRARELPGRGNLQPYRCPHCLSWHFGHKAGTRKPAEADETRYTSGDDSITTGGGEG